MSLAYLSALLVSLTGLVIVDLRWALFFWRDPARATFTLAAGVAFFLTADLAGIGLGIFLLGDGPYLSGVLLAPELPVEELLFLVFFCYLTMVLHSTVMRWQGRAARP